MPELTIFQPAYRVERWAEYLKSIEASCQRHTYEVVFCGPKHPITPLPFNCKFILDKGSPARCANIAAQNSDGELILLGSDDALFLPNLLDEMLDAYNNWIDISSIRGKVHRWVMPIRYGENHTWMPPEYWRLHHHPTLRGPGIPDHILTLNVLCSKTYWIEMGGYDCENFNTCNWGGHDLNLRFLNDGAKFLEFEPHIMMCDWDCGGKDHSPMVESERGDLDRFNALYGAPNVERKRIDINNWQTAPEVWPFGKLRH